MKKIFIGFLFVFTLLSCKKYEDGPLISFRSLPERLSNHWKPEKKFINDQETTLTDEEQRTVYTFDKSGIFIKRIPNGPYYSSYHGTWEFTDKKEKIKTLLSYIQFGNPVTEEREYKILRLKEKELRLIYTDSANDEVEIHFIPE